MSASNPSRALRQRLDAMRATLCAYDVADQTASVPAADQSVANFMATATLDQTPAAIEAFRKVSAIRFLGDQQGGNQFMQFVGHIVSDYDVRLAQVKYGIDIHNRWDEIVTETPEDVARTLQSSLYLLDWLVGLPRREARQTFTDNLERLKNALVTRLQVPLYERTVGGDDEYRRFVASFGRTTGGYPITDLGSFLTNVLPRAVEYANACTLAEYEIAHKALVDAYYGTTATGVPAHAPPPTIEAYTRNYCRTQMLQHYRDFLDRAKDALLAYDASDEPTRADIVRLIDEAKRPYARVTARGAYTHTPVDPIPTQTADGGWQLEQCVHTYENQWLGNRVWRTVQSVRCACDELVAEYSTVLRWSSNALAPLDRVEWDWGKLQAATTPIPSPPKRCEWDAFRAYRTRLAKDYAIQPPPLPTPSTLQQFGTAWRQIDGMDSPGIVDPNGWFFRSISVIYKTARRVGCAVRYTIQMLAQLLAPLVSLPLLVVTQILKVLWREAWCKCAYDDLSTGPFGGVCPPLEALASLVQLAYLVLRLLFRPVMMPVRTILYAMQRILQETAKLLKSALFWPLMQTPRRFSGSNFLMKLVAHSKGIADAKIRRVVRTARYKQMVVRYNTTLSAYARRRLNDELAERPDLCEEDRISQTPSASNSATMTYRTPRVRTSDDCVDAITTTDVTVVPRADPALEGAINRIHQASCVLTVGEFEWLKASLQNDNATLSEPPPVEPPGESPTSAELLSQIEPFIVDDDASDQLFSSLDDYALSLPAPAWVEPMK